MIRSVAKRQRVSGGWLPTSDVKVGSCSGSLCNTKEKVEPNLIRTQNGWLRLLRFASVCRTKNEGQKEIIKN